MSNQVTVEDWGLKTLAEDAKRELLRVMDEVAELVAGRMKANMAGGGSYSTGASASSVKVWDAGSKGAKEFGRNIGPTKFYAYWLETGWVQVVAWGQQLREVIHHPGRGFARAALESAAGAFEERISAAMQRLGR